MRHRALDSMGDMELCPSKNMDINSIACLSGQWCQINTDVIDECMFLIDAADIVKLHVDPSGTQESGQ